MIAYGIGFLPLIKDLHKHPLQPRVISIPWMSDAGVSSTEILDEGEEPYAICDHGKGVPLRHALLAVQEVA